VELNYYVYGFDTAQMNMLYVEHPTAEYYGPFVIKGYLELEESVSKAMKSMMGRTKLSETVSKTPSLFLIMTR
jgi:hypothetical protein